MNRRSTLRPVRDEAGFTLIEVIVTVAIMAISFVVIVGGLGTAILGSDISRRQATAQSVLRSSAEAVKGAGYVDCAGAVTYPLPVVQGYAVSITGVTYWDQGANTFVSESQCTNDPGLQLLTIKVEPQETAKGHNLEPRTLQVVKRKDAK
jgi:prepilin-type N-terminal cleavage/methylation domain-containing protein